MVLDGVIMKKFTVAHSVTFYEQSLVDAMRLDMGVNVSDSSTLLTVPIATSLQSAVGKGVHNLAFQGQSPVTDL